VGAWPDPAGSGKIRPGLSRGSATYCGRDGPGLGPGASEPGSGFGLIAARLHAGDIVLVGGTLAQA
jgi:hypothetical protein